MKKATAATKSNKATGKIAAKKPAAKSVTKKESAPKKEKVVAQKSAHAWALANIKKPTDAAARKLVIGDVIEVFYADDTKPVIEVVVKSCDRDEDIFGVATVMQVSWGTRQMDMTKVNSDMWRKIGTMKFKLTKD